jgi:hypothetical protein
MALVPFPQKSVTPAEEPDWENDPESAEGGKMSFLEHLDELRRRLIWSVVSLVFGVVVAAFFLDERTYGPIGRTARGRSGSSISSSARCRRCSSLARRCSSSNRRKPFRSTSSWR